jgi:hypothetical protein
VGFLEDLRVVRAKEWQRGENDRDQFLAGRAAARSRLKRSFVRALAGLVIAAAMVAGIALWSSARRTAGSNARAQREVVALMRFVESIRDLKFLRSVPVELLPKERFDELPGADPSFIRDALVGVYPLFEPLGLSTGPDDPSEVTSRFFGADIGYYDHNSRRLYVRGSTFNTFTRSVLVHELTHALDDQHFDFASLEASASEHGHFYEALALIEGDARRLQDEYLKSVGASDAATTTGTRLSARLRGTEVAPQFAELLAFPYDAGEAFVRALVKHGGEEAVNDAFSEPPILDHEILQPDLYIDSRARLRLLSGLARIPEPSAVGKNLTDVRQAYVFDELILRLFLQPTLGASRASIVASHWSGDKGITWYNGRVNCIRVFYSPGSSSDRAALEDGLRRWVRRHQRATLRVGEYLDLTSCA